MIGPGLIIGVAYAEDLVKVYTRALPLSSSTPSGLADMVITSPSMIIISSIGATISSFGGVSIMEVGVAETRGRSDVPSKLAAKIFPSSSGDSPLFNWLSKKLPRP